jgi:hypothetical protein
MDQEYFENKKDADKENAAAANVKLGVNPATIGRLALSKSICRFELPMDMKLLESMSPPQYLENFCRVNDRRKAFYRRIFEKYKIRSEKEDYIDMKVSIYDFYCLIMRVVHFVDV